MLSVFCHLAKSLTTTQCRRPLTQLMPLAPNMCTRFFASRRDCAIDEAPRCSPENLERKPCEPDKNPIKKSWFNPECCNNPCIDAMPRFDDLYYKPSDKRNRKYTQTWAECPVLKIAPRKICCFEQIQMPPRERRPRKVRCFNSCSSSFEDKMLMICKNRGNQKCSKITMPGCCGARDPPRCFIVRKPSGCKKLCAPYPAYSECCHPEVKPLRPTECECLKMHPFCRYN